MIRWDFVSIGCCYVIFKKWPKHYVFVLHYVHFSFLAQRTSFPYKSQLFRWTQVEIAHSLTHSSRAVLTVYCTVKKLFSRSVCLFISFFSSVVVVERVCSQSSCWYTLNSNGLYTIIYWNPTHAPKFCSLARSLSSLVTWYICEINKNICTNFLKFSVSSFPYSTWYNRERWLDLF